MDKKIRILAVLGVSGSGKTELERGLTAYEGEDFGQRKFVKLQQVTTRKRRTGENEHSYMFVTDAEYNMLREQGKLTAITTVVGHRYGTFLDPNRLAMMNDLDTTIFTVVVNPAGYESLMELTKDVMDDYTYVVRGIRVKPVDGKPYAERENRDYKQLSEEVLRLSALNDVIYPITNYTDISAMSKLVYKFVTVNPDSMFEHNGNVYQFKTPLMVLKELGEVDEDWNKFIYI